VYGPAKLQGPQRYAPVFVNPWANPYLPFAQRLAATVSGSWAGTLPSPAPGFSHVRPGRLLNGSPQFSWPIAAQPTPAFGWDGPPRSDNPIYPPAAPFPMYAPPIVSPMPPPPLERIGGPPSSVQISERNATNVASSDQAPQQDVRTDQECPAVVELMNGYVYTVRKYWVSDGGFNFITTQFDHIHVPLAQLQRLTPRGGGEAVAPTSLGSRVSSQRRADVNRRAPK
jgi:hypothetical protein